MLPLRRTLLSRALVLHASSGMTEAMPRLPTRRCTSVEVATCALTDTSMLCDGRLPVVLTPAGGTRLENFVWRRRADQPGGVASSGKGVFFCRITEGTGDSSARTNPTGYDERLHPAGGRTVSSDRTFVVDVSRKIRQLVQGDEYIGLGARQRGLGRSLLCKQFKVSASWTYCSH